MILTTVNINWYKIVNHWIGDEVPQRKTALGGRHEFRRVRLSQALRDAYRRLAVPCGLTLAVALTLALPASAQQPDATASPRTSQDAVVPDPPAPPPPDESAES